MKLITFTGYKGGVAKSTSAIHIATFLSGIGKVLLVDGDRNRSSIAWCERGHMPFDVADQNAALKKIGSQDYVVIDTAAQPSMEELKVLAEGCDLLILPTSPDVISLDPMIQTSKDLGTALHRALITIVPPKPSKEGEILRTELLDAGIPVFNAMIRRSAGISKAAMRGKPLRDMPARYQPAWWDYKALGKEILELIS